MGCVGTNSRCLNHKLVAPLVKERHSKISCRFTAGRQELWTTGIVLSNHALGCPEDLCQVFDLFRPVYHIDMASNVRGHSLSSTKTVYGEFQGEFEGSHAKKESFIYMMSR